MTATAPPTTRRQFFPPELLVGDLDHVRQADLADYFVDVAAVRGFPCHLNVLFNALYFGFDPAVGGYEMDGEFPFEDHIGFVTHGETGHAVPVGAFVEVSHRGGKTLAGEVVAKEGRHPDTEPAADADLGRGLADDVGALVDHDTVDGDLAGRPAGSDGRVREVLIIDFGTFVDLGVDDDTVATAVDARGWVDDFGHVVMDATYPDSTGVDDVDHYIDWLVARRGDRQLLGWCFDVQPGEAPPDGAQLTEALRGAFRTIRRIVVDDPRLAVWGDYVWGADRYAAATDVECDGPVDGTGPLDGGDLETIWSDLTYPPDGDDPVYRPLAPRLRRCGEAWRDRGYDPLATTGWVTATVCVSRWVADRIHREAVAGVLERVDVPVHVRIDDRWQAGGLWRIEHADPPPPWVAVPPDVVLGLGSGTGPDDVAGTDVDVDEPDLTLLDDDAVRWFAALRPSWLADDLLTLPAALADRFAPGARLTVVVRHDVTPTWRLQGGWTGTRNLEELVRAEVTVDADLRCEVLWPVHLQAGVKLTCDLQGTTLVCSTRALQPPEQVGDLRYTHVYDRQVARQIAGLPPLERPRDGRSARQSLAGQIAGLFAVHTGVDDDGGRLLTWTQLATGVFGPPARGDVAVRLRVAATCRQMGLGIRRDGAVWPHDRPAGQTSPTGGSADAWRQLRRRVKRRWVRMYLRRLPRGQQPSPGKVADYPQARIDEGVVSVTPPTLPRGHTWVEGFYRSR